MDKGSERGPCWLEKLHSSLIGGRDLYSLCSYDTYYDGLKIGPLSATLSSASGTEAGLMDAES